MPCPFSLAKGEESLFFSAFKAQDCRRNSYLTAVFSSRDCEPTGDAKTSLGSGK